MSVKRSGITKIHPRDASDFARCPLLNSRYSCCFGKQWLARAETTNFYSENKLLPFAQVSWAKIVRLSLRNCHVSPRITRLSFLRLPALCGKSLILFIGSRESTGGLSFDRQTISFQILFLSPHHFLNIYIFVITVNFKQ